MGKLSARLENGRKALGTLVRLKAFESYVRRGHVPLNLARLSAIAANEQKFFEFAAGLSTKALRNGKATTHYTWRTAGDDKVRHAHAALEGKVFSWSSPPEGGHPGDARNCRCWAEPYYGDPAVPDSLLQLARDRQILSDPQQRIASIETLTRPDATVAASSIDMVDGTSINSVFQGSSVSQLVSFPDGVDYQSLRVGTTRELTVRQGGETRLRVAQLRLFAPGVLPPLVPPPVPAHRPADLSGPPPTEVTAAPYAALIRGALELYNTAVAAPEPMGLGDGDLPVMAIKIWQGVGSDGSVVVTKEVLSSEQVSQTCKRLPEVQSWASEAAATLAHLRSELSPQDFGTKLHTLVHYMILALKAQFPLDYVDVSSELSITRDGITSDDIGGPHYGAAGTVRLDVVEKVNSSTACLYDFKSGRTGLPNSRAEDFIRRASHISDVEYVIVIPIQIP
jgi:SPP1 gp7 family putative phage head morphogenesis protein